MKGLRTMFFSSYSYTWSMCLFTFAFFAAFGALAYWLRFPKLDISLRPGPIAAVFGAIALVLMAVLLTLIDKPHLNASREMIEWYFMFSAFLGIPVAMPFIAGAVWALAHYLKEEEMELGGLLLVCLGAFALGCAASNMHDVAWCGIITKGYSEHYKAGFDLDIFVAFAKWFGIPEEISADYLTLGPYTVVMVLGELTAAAGAFLRLHKLYRG